ncbi:hypothetical protein ACFRAO_42845 [Streptomyces sp. NPDC056656]|uniref:hypothetical protein n=1 Tax=Streptomyces sp. NPDC056656 TaxID=3345895 RepID=UPI0036AB7522
MKKTGHTPSRLPDRARLVMAVMSATGGSGRSTVAGLLADRMAQVSSTVVVDLAPRLSSPWPRLAAGQDATGLAGLPPDQPQTRSQVRGACATSSGGDGHPRWHFLTDLRDWHASPLRLPEEAAPWYQLASAGGWQTIIADTRHTVGHDIVQARYSVERASTREWYELPYTIGVLTATATSSGIQTLQQAVRALQADGLPLNHTVIALVSVGDGRIPPAVQAAATMLKAHVPAVVRIPYDPVIRAQGLSRRSRLRSRTREAIGDLADAVTDTAREAWGDPLPDAPQPAALALSTTAL